MYLYTIYTQYWVYLIPIQNSVYLLYISIRVYLAYIFTFKKILELIVYLWPLTAYTYVSILIYKRKCLNREIAGILKLNVNFVFKVLTLTDYIVFATSEVIRNRVPIHRGQHFLTYVFTCTNVSLYIIIHNIKSRTRRKSHNIIYYKL